MVSFRMTFIVSRLNGIIPNDIYCKSFEWYHSEWHLVQIVHIILKEVNDMKTFFSNLI